MEKIISVEERIKRAEQRYYNTLGENSDNVKRESIKNNEINKTNTDNKKSKKTIIKKKLLIQMCICLIIYAIFYCINNSNTLLSNDMKSKAQEILNTDINFSQIYSNIKNNLEEYLKKVQDNKQEDNTQSTESIEKIDEEIKTEDIQNNDKNIGGAIEDIDLQIGETSEIEEIGKQANGEETIENQNNVEQTSAEKTNGEQIQNDSNEQEGNEANNQENQLSQMEQDANWVKENISIIKPINGVVSSRYGLRNPTTITVPKNHTGIDLAAVTGTKIVSATDGIVVLNSSKGDYGNHLKIQNGDTIFIYAHCNKLYVNEGDEIKQGQEIAEVGATGNATGPHLHFEIRYQNRLINPELILEF